MEYVQRFQDGKWIQGKVFGALVKYLDGSEAPYSEKLTKFPTDLKDKKLAPKVVPLLEALGPD